MLERKAPNTSEDGRSGAGSLTVRAILFVLYIIIGVVLAASHHYFVHLDALKPIASAVLAVLLWPLVLFGVSLHLN
ncbi:MAG: hypothetical protein ACXVEI_04365 [Actinomycetota bacterium]